LPNPDLRDYREAMSYSPKYRAEGTGAMFSPREQSIWCVGHRAKGEVNIQSAAHELREVKKVRHGVHPEARPVCGLAGVSQSLIPPD